MGRIYTFSDKNKSPENDVEDQSVDYSIYESVVIQIFKGFKIAQRTIKRFCSRKKSGEELARISGIFLNTFAFQVSL